MTAKALLCRVLAVSTCCLMLTACGSKNPEASKPEEAQPVPSQPETKPGGVKVEPKPTSTKTSSKAEPASKQRPGTKATAQLSNEEVHQKLNEFAQKTVTEMNRYVVPSKNKKEVAKNPDGSFTCRYIEVDPASIRTSFKKPESSSAVTYIGYLTYEEGVYACKAPTKEAAMAGPFNPQQRNSLTELIKYTPKSGWSY